ncbi:MAG: hypothetical protein U5K79_15385 [Cyclobacteriaceae bacterium]|nr:hypothetical protein [Cyclobacteriaceae bacterium]
MSSLFSLSVVIPIGLLIGSLVEEVKVLKEMHNAGTLTIPPPNEKVKEWPVVGNKIYGVWQAASTNMEQTVIEYKEQLTDMGKTVVKGILGSVSAIVQNIAHLLIAGILLVFGESESPYANCSERSQVPVAMNLPMSLLRPWAVW